MHNPHETELLRTAATQEDPATIAAELAPFLTPDGELNPAVMARAVPADVYIARIRAARDR